MIFKSDISNYFLVAFFLLTSTAKEEHKLTYTTKRIIKNDQSKCFKQKLYQTICDDIKINKKSK